MTDPTPAAGSPGAAQPTPPAQPRVPAPVPGAPQGTPPAQRQAPTAVLGAPQAGPPPGAAAAPPGYTVPPSGGQWGTHPGGPWGGPWGGPPPAAVPPRPGQPLPPRPPSALRRRWPGPVGAAPPAVLGAATAAAAVAASVVPLDRPGAGWLLASLAGAGALGTAAAVRTASPEASTVKPSATPQPSASPAPSTPAATPEQPAPTPSAVARPSANPVPSAPEPSATPEQPAPSAVAEPSGPQLPGPSPAGTGAAPNGSPATAVERSAAEGKAVPAEPAARSTSAAGALGSEDASRQAPTARSEDVRGAGPIAGVAGTSPTPAAGSGGGTGSADVRPGATGAPGRAVRLAWAVATIALVAVGSVRAAGWLFVLCVLAAVLTASLALTGGRTPFGMLMSVVLPPAAAARALPWAARGLSGTRRDGLRWGRSLASVAVSVGLLVLFGLLFSSADAIFADLLTSLLPDVSVSGVTNWVLRWALVGVLLLGGAYLLTRPPDLDGLSAAPARTVRRLEWALPLATLDALFAVFVLVQLTVLFGGSDHVLRTAGLSYAQYARSGFWQLLAVSALTLLVIAGAVRWAPRAERADRILIRTLLGVLTALSLVVVASALYRMQVYAEAYGATRLRLVVATVEIWLGVLFVLVAVAVLRLRGGWLPRLVLATGVVALLGLAAVDPDRLIADRNVERYLDSGRLDVAYLSGLSADAVPALDRLPEPMRSCALRTIATELPEDGLGAANLGRARARALLGPDPAEAHATGCPYPNRW